MFYLSSGVSLRMRTAVILGTRPEIIKMSPILREFKQRNIDYFVVHTGQHYSYELDRAFFEDLKLEEPDINLNVGSGSHAVQTGKILEGVEDHIKQRTDLVLVQGDTNTVLGGSLAAAKLNIPVGHVEAGLRSFDRSMPEEINRLVADHVSSYLFAPTEVSRANLLKEGIDESSIYVAGNTVVDAVYQNVKIAETSRDPLDYLGLKRQQYFLATSHRAENTDNPDRLRDIIEAFRKILTIYNLPIIYPIHPRAAKMIKQFRVNVDGIMIIPPVGYFDFLLLEKNAKLVLTDSGGVQEETCVLGVPCVTLRDNTERPETIDVKSNLLAGTRPDIIVDCVDRMLGRERNWNNPYGDGRAGEKIVNIIYPD